MVTTAANDVNRNLPVFHRHTRSARWCGGSHFRTARRSGTVGDHNANAGHCLSGEPTMISRRTFLGTATAAFLPALGTAQPTAAKKKLAVVTNVWTYRSHA